LFHVDINFCFHTSYAAGTQTVSCPKEDKEEGSEAGDMQTHGKREMSRATSKKQ
jgi:hypothetical protein